TGTDDVPDLHGKIDALWTVDPDGTLTPVPVAQGNDDFGRGTAVASVIAATVDDGFGMAGFGGATHVITVHASTGTEISDTRRATTAARAPASSSRCRRPTHSRKATIAIRNGPGPEVASTATSPGPRLRHRRSPASPP